MRFTVPREETLPDLVSGLMWLATAITGLAVLLLPGTSHRHMAWLLGLAAFAATWGAISVTLGMKAKTMSINARAAVTAAMAVVISLALWASGGANSFLQPILMLTTLFLAYFFPPRLVWWLSAIYVAAFASPLFYDKAARAAAYPARVVMFAMAVVGETIAVYFLKQRLVRAEERQRRMAERDPLTGVLNRRSFDAALEEALESVEPQPPETGLTIADGEGSAALVLFDFNDFKLINDVHGHPVGDAVLRSVALAGEGVVRDGDCLARIGGDEFALVAPGAGHVGALRLVDALDDAIRNAHMPPGVGSVHATFGWAVAPDDGTDSDALLARADERLLQRKRARVEEIIDLL